MVACGLATVCISLSYSDINDQTFQDLVCDTQVAISVSVTLILIFRLETRI